MPHTSPRQTRRKLLLLPLSLAASLVTLSGQGADDPSRWDRIKLSSGEAVEQALLNNRQLQIERINQSIAYFTLHSSYGIYDPRIDTRIDREESSDTGGFDPANFSNDAIFRAESEVATVGLFGYLPSGMLFNVGGSYAHSAGERNFLNFDSYKLGANVYAEQPLLKNFWIDQPRWIIKVNKKNLEMSEFGVEFMAMSIINLTLQGYYDLLYAWENLEIQTRLLETREAFVAGIKRQVELGTLTKLEEKLAQSQAATSQTEIISARNAVALASNNLRTLMGMTRTNWSVGFIYSEEFLLTVPTALDLQESWRSGLENRPDYHQLAVNLESANITVSFRKNQLFPLLNLFGSYGLKGSDAIQAFPPDNPRADWSLALEEIKERSAPNSTIGVFLSIPLTSKAERSNYKASKELRRQAEVMLKQKEELIMREISDAIETARFSFDRALAAKSAVDFAREALAAEEEKLRGGTGSIFLVLQAQTDLARAQISEIMAKRDYNKALAQLYFAEGSILKRYNLDLEFR